MAQFFCCESVEEVCRIVNAHLNFISWLLVISPLRAVRYSNQQPVHVCGGRGGRCLVCTVWRSLAAGFRLNNVSLPGSIAGGVVRGRTMPLGGGWRTFPCVDASTRTPFHQQLKRPKSRLYIIFFYL